MMRRSFRLRCWRDFSHIFRTRPVLLLQQRARHKSLQSTDVNKLLTEPYPLGQRCIRGWVQSVREHKDVTFIHITDGLSRRSLQVVAKPSLLTSLQVSYGSSVEVQGNLVPSSYPGQPVELQAEDVKMVGPCDHMEYPFKLRKNHPPDYVRQYLHLRPKTQSFSSLLRVRSAVSHAIHEYFQERNFIQIHTPVLTSNDCEGAGEVFQVEPAGSWEPVTDTDGERSQHFFNVPAFLTVSGQLHLEVAAGALQRVYTFGPTFRAENSRSRHHLSEFYMVEAELAFTQSLSDVTELMESLMQETTKKILRTAGDDIDSHIQRAPPSQKDVLEKLANHKYVRMSYDEAIAVLQKHEGKFQHTPKWGCDLQKEHERHLVAYCDNTPVFVLDFPKDIKPFYMRENPDERTVAAVDLLAPDVGEVCGGSLREERPDVLQPRLQKLSLERELDWYLDLRKFGTTPHGGFGLGFERYLQVLLGISNIKDTIPFPRSTHNCKM